MRCLAGVVGIAVLLSCGFARGELADLKAEVEKLRKEIAARETTKAPAIGKAVDAAVAGKYGPNAPVRTKDGTLQIGGLLQVWYQGVQNDHSGVIKPADGNQREFPEGNETLDNDTFRIRRAELRFTWRVHENVLACIMIDPARESNYSYMQRPTAPQHNQDEGVAKTQYVQTGVANAYGWWPSLLQDVYINYHGVIPHHDFTIGQFKAPAGSEGWRNSGQLDFVERAMVTSISNIRDIGAMVHGTWVDDRVQYWVGAFNGPSRSILADPEIFEAGNRTDDNDEKDISWRVAVQPVWSLEKWYGRLELGYARTDGIRGESGNWNMAFLDLTANNALNEQRTDVNRQAAWAFYRPNGKVKGWWLRGEWGSSRGRFDTAISATALAGSTTDDLGLPTSFLIQNNPAPVTASGWYASTGYKMSESIWSDSLAKGGALSNALRNLEFAFRYEQYQNIAVEDPAYPERHTDLFKTKVYTAGVNYYLSGHEAKIQANYMWVDDPQSSIRGLREVRNDTFVVNFQVMF